MIKKEILFLILIFGFIFLYQAFPKKVNEIVIPKEGLLFKNEEGKIIARLSPSGFSLMDEKGEERIAIYPDGIEIYNEEGEGIFYLEGNRIHLKGEEQERITISPRQIIITNKKGADIFALENQEENGNLTIGNEEGGEILILGVNEKGGYLEIFDNSLKKIFKKP
ncbi:MAG: hypothetical protein ABIK77_06120 [candidate division WOR-3 bacterium]